MADLDGKDASQSVKVSGASIAGIESNYMDVDSGGNALVSPISRNLNLSGTAAALNADAVASTDANGYQTISVQITGTWVGTLSFQCSNDNVNFVPAVAFEVGSSSKSSISATTANGIFFIPLHFRYFRLRMTTYTSGTATATSVADSLPSNDSQISSSDILNSGGLDKILALTTTPVQAIVGTTAKPGRKYFIMEAQSTNVVWGFSNTTQSFDLFKSQLVMIPVGSNTQIWMKVTSSTGSCAIGEL